MHSDGALGMGVSPVIYRWTELLYTKCKGDHMALLPDRSMNMDGKPQKFDGKILLKIASPELPENNEPAFMRYLKSSNGIDQ